MRTLFVPEEATILHADADAFFASVEQRDDPRRAADPRRRARRRDGGELRGQGFRRRGGMRSSRRGGYVPDIVAVPSRFDAYVAASKELFEVFEADRPGGRGALDGGGVPGRPRAGADLPEHLAAIAERLRRRARERVGLAVTVGVARTKVLAKMASRAGPSPTGSRSSSPSRGVAFLRPLPVEALWGVGRFTAEGSALMASRRSESSSAATRPSSRCSGSHAARHLHGIANRRDPRPVRRGQRRRSIGTQSAFAGGRKSGVELDALLVTLVDRVTRRARAANRAGRTVTLRLRFADFSRATRSRTLAHPTAGTGRDPGGGEGATRRGQTADRAARDHVARNCGGQPQ